MALGMTVVIAAYRAERTLRAALESVLAQTSPVDEVILVDDGSDDGTAAVADGFGHPVHVIRLPRNSGVAAALNHGIDAASMPILTFIDADDLWPPGRVAAQRAALTDVTIDLVDGWSVQFDDPTYSVHHPAAVVPSGPPQPGPGKATMAIRRSAFDAVGAFDPAFRSGDAIEWLSRPSVRELRRVTVPDVLHFRRVHGANLGVRERDQQRDEYASVMRAISRRRREQRS